MGPLDTPDWLKRNLQAQATPATVPQEGPERPLQATQQPQDEGYWADPWQTLQNAPGSLVKQVKGLVWDLPVAVAKQVYNVAKDPEALPKMLLEGVPALANAIGKDYKNAYWENPGREIEADPFRFVGDIAGVATMGAGSAASAGTKLAQVTRTTAPGVARGAAAVASVGRKAARVANAFDPAALPFNSIPVVSRWLGDITGMTKDTAPFNVMRATIASEVEREIATNAFKTIVPDLTDVEMPFVLDALYWGDATSVAKLSPKARQALDTYDAYLKMDENLARNVEKIIDDTGMWDSRAIQAKRWRMQSKGEDIPLATIKEMMKRGEINPRYTQIYASPDGSSFWDHLYEQMYRNGTLRRAESRAATGQLPTDINEVIANQIKASAVARGKMKLTRAIVEYQSQKGKLHVPKSDAERLWLKEQGYAPFQGPFAEEYFEVYSSAVQEIGRAAVKPGATAKSIAEAAERYTDVAVKAKEMLRNQPKELWVPKDVAAWLINETTPAIGGSMLERAFRAATNMGGGMQYFKALATVFNPRYWIPIAVSGAVLSAVYGVHPMSFVNAQRLKEFLPLELQRIVAHPIYSRDQNAFIKGANFLGNVSHRVDNFFKSAFYVDKLTKDAIKRGVLKSSSLFFTAFEDVKKLLQEHQFSNNDWVENLSQLQLAKRDIADLAIRGARADRKWLSKAAILQKRIKALGADRSPMEAYATQGLVAAGPRAWEKKEYQHVLSPTEQQPSLPYDPRLTVEQAEAAFRFNRQMAMDTPDINIITGDKVPPLIPGVQPLPVRASRRINNENLLRDLKSEMDALKFAAIQSIADAGKLAELSPKLAAASARADKAISVGNQFFGSYQRLNPFERKILREVIPFYTFTKAMTTLAFRFPFMFPKRTFFGLGLLRAIEDIVEDNEFHSTWMKDFTIVGADADGNPIAIRHGAWNPMNSVRVNQVGEAPIPSMWDVLAQHPAIRLVMNAYGKLTPKPVSPGERMVRLDNGEVWEFKNKGIKRTVARPPFWRDVWKMFPQSFIIDSVFLNAVQTDRGWLLNPDPIQRNGKPLYPLGWEERLASVIVPTTRVNTAALRARENAKYHAVQVSFGKKLKAAPPEEKANIRMLLKELRQNIDSFYLEY